MSSSLAADAAFDFTFPSCDPATPPPPAISHSFSYNPSSLLEIPFQPYGGNNGGNHHGHGHARSSSQCSAYSAYSYASSTPSEAFLTTPAVSAYSTRNSTPVRSPIRTHGPLLLPKIRSQDQALGPEDATIATAPLKRARASPVPTTPGSGTTRSRSTTSVNRRRSALATPKQPYAASVAAASRHMRSLTNPDSVVPFNASQSFSVDNTQEQAASARAVTPVSVFESTPPPPTLLCSPVNFVQSSTQLSQLTQSAFPQQQHHHHHHQSESIHSRRASTCSLDGSFTLDGKFDYEYGFAPYPGTVPTNYMTADGSSQERETYLYRDQEQQPQQYMPRETSPLSVESASPEPVVLPAPLSIPVTVPVITATPPSATSAPATSGPTTSLVTYLTAPNPAPALVRTISFPLRDPNTKHYWWDVRQVRPWSSFTMPNLSALPGASSVLTCPMPVSLLPTPHAPARSIHPETESDLHNLCAAHYLPRINAALAFSSSRPIQLTSSTASVDAVTASTYDEFFVGHVAGDSAPAAALFGGKPTARVVGLVKSFDRFNTGMRAEGNIKRVEYLRGLAHLHHLMREHSCRYGFLITEIELVIVRNGTETTPQFGQLEVASVPLAKTTVSSQAVDDIKDGLAETPLTAGLALWGLCMLASDEMAAAAVSPSAASSMPLLCSYSTHIGAPAEGTRRKAAPRASWMPLPQLAEKRTAKRARGWVMPEDAVGRKEMGRRGVRYNGAH
ncbi:sialidase-like protein [Sporothrix schenckii 1099-18]|uniref:Sialidase-like protein n=1 Tax=Sporothrix schenckii 1099-18 TaxID=1397361 RepID=A0A0F2M2Y7_SPOSC|nr:sialidase-like protein [Sporothrix schenckii 1099-18]KJR84073.1 sialidase-like protein [Sporothrix schenckii 1099-18]